MSTIDRLLGRESSGERLRERARERNPKLVDLGDEAAEEVVGALGAGTARVILDAVYEDPRTASELAEAADTSLQNAIYHLEKLEAAGLVEVADTWYSDRGTEMKVYAPANGAVVLVAGDEEAGSAVLDALKRAVGGLAVVGLASLAVGRALEWLRPREGGGQEARTEAMMAAGEGGAESAETTVTAATDGGSIPELVAALPPEALLFAGGAFAVLVMTAVWYADRR